MLITKDFIVINNPKTGSSFVRKVLKEIYAKRTQKHSWLKRKSITWKLTSPELVELFIAPLSSEKLPPNQHGAASQIPKKHKSKVIVSVIRNPYTKILSQYEFGWWAKNSHLFIDENVVKSKFPDFPNINLNEFTDFQILSQEFKYPHLKTKPIGIQTIEFIEMFFNNPLEVITTINNDYIFSGAYKKDLKTITFLQQENLAEDLIHFLSQYDYTPQELDIIKNYEKVNVTKNKHPNRMELHTKKTLEYIKTYERLLFKIYEDLGIFYEAP